MDEVPIIEWLPIVGDFPVWGQSIAVLVLIALAFFFAICCLVFAPYRPRPTTTVGTRVGRGSTGNNPRHPLGLGAIYAGPTDPHYIRFPGGTPPAGWRPGLDPIRFATKAMRAEVLARQGNSCAYCGAHGRGVMLHMDHIIPWSWKGATHPVNLQGLCVPCNLAKGDLADHVARQLFYEQTGRLPADMFYHQAATRR
jgi:hypothetical protein